MLNVQKVFRNIANCNSEHGALVPSITALPFANQRSPSTSDSVAGTQAATSSISETSPETPVKGPPPSKTAETGDEAALTPYNPNEHRHVEYPNSVTGSVINLIKACLGTGILAMPAAFKQSGLVIGSVGIMIAGLVVTNAVYILVQTAQEACVQAKVPSMSFSEACGAAFTYGPKKCQPWGPFIEEFADICLVLCYTGVLCIYVVFIATSLKEVFDVISPDNKLDVKVYCAIILLPLILICQIRSLKFVVPFSALANIGIFVIIVITFYFIFTDLPSLSGRALVAPYAHWPLFISIAVFSIEGVGVVMPVENEMARPEKFLSCPGVLGITMFIVVFLYAFVGFFGYVKYGDDVKGSVTLNLPKNSMFATCTKLLMAGVIFLTYLLQFYVPMEAVTRRLHHKHVARHYNLIQITTRTAIVTLSVIIAVLVPNLELVISLVGAIFFSTCGIILPAIVQTVFRWERDLGPYNYLMWKNLFIFIIGLITFVSGTLVAILEI